MKAVKLSLMGALLLASANLVQASVIYMARQLYAAKQPLLALVDPKTRPCLSAIIGV